MEKINFPNNQHNLFCRLLCSYISNLSKEKEKEYWKILEEKSFRGEKDLEVVFQVNGIDLPVLEVFQQIEDDYDRQLRIDAKKFLEEKHADILETCDDFHEKLTDTFKVISNKLRADLKLPADEY